MSFVIGYGDPTGAIRRIHEAAWNHARSGRIGRGPTSVVAGTVAWNRVVTDKDPHHLRGTDGPTLTLFGVHLVLDALRDAFADVLRGVSFAEEVRDITAEVTVKPEGSRTDQMMAMLGKPTEEPKPEPEEPQGDNFGLGNLDEEPADIAELERKLFAWSEEKGMSDAAFTDFITKHSKRQSAVLNLGDLDREELSAVCRAAGVL